MCAGSNLDLVGPGAEALERQVKETDELAAELEELKREYGVA